MTTSKETKTGGTGIWVERWKGGDPDALGQLARRFTPLLGWRIRNHASWQVLSRKYTVEDVVQEVWQRVLTRGKRTFETRESSSFSSWLGTVCDSVLTDLRRHEDAVKRGSGETPDPLDSRAAGGALLPGAAAPVSVSAPARFLELRQIAGETLGERELMACVLVFFMDYLPEEAGLALGCSSSAIRNLLRRARLKLGDKLDEWV